MRDQMDQEHDQDQEQEKRFPEMLPYKSDATLCT